MKWLDIDPWDDLGNWPADAYRFKGMQLSHSMMRNEINEREPRIIQHDGKSVRYSVCGKATGFHSEHRPNRKSEIEDLGEGTVLYFKFMKYFMFLFVLCFGLSCPSLIIYTAGLEYTDIEDKLTHYLGYTVMGNLGDYSDVLCHDGEIPPNHNGASYIGFHC